MQLAAATGISRLALMLRLIQPPLSHGDLTDTQIMKQVRQVIYIVALWVKIHLMSYGDAEIRVKDK